MGKHILLGITGGIAAYKSCELVRLLKKQGYSVSVVMTDSATEFVSPLTFQALTGNPVLSDTYSGASNNGMAHINLTREADAFLIAPATANTIAKIANGLADNLLTNLVAARKCPLAVAPAMNVEMWNNPANLRNIEQLVSDGITVFYPNNGEQACGEAWLILNRLSAQKPCIRQFTAISMNKISLFPLQPLQTTKSKTVATRN